MATWNCLVWCSIIDFQPSLYFWPTHTTTPLPYRPKISDLYCFTYRTFLHLKNVVDYTILLTMISLSLFLSSESRSVSFFLSHFVWHWTPPYFLCVVLEHASTKGFPTNVSVLHFTTQIMTFFAWRTSFLHSFQFFFPTREK